MHTLHALFPIQSEARISVHNVTEHVQEILAYTGIQNGIAVIYSQHKTCCVMIQEESQDIAPEGTKHLQGDLLDFFQAIIPHCSEGEQFLHVSDYGGMET